MVRLRSAGSCHNANYLSEYRFVGFLLQLWEEPEVEFNWHYLMVQMVGVYLRSLGHRFYNV